MQNPYGTYGGGNGGYGGYGGQRAYGGQGGHGDYGGYGNGGGEGHDGHYGRGGHSGRGGAGAHASIDRRRAPTKDQLRQAAAAFTDWVHGRPDTANATVTVAGGFAVWSAGGHRTTRDIDMAIDLRPTGNNLYEVVAAMDATSLFRQDGDKRYVRLPDIDVEIDVLEADLFYGPWDPPAMTEISPQLRLRTLKPPMLLVAKIRLVVEREGPEDPRTLVGKQQTDIQDIRFLLQHCLLRRLRLQEAHLLHLGDQGPWEFVQPALDQTLSLAEPSWGNEWIQLCQQSQADPMWYEDLTL